MLRLIKLILWIALITLWIFYWNYANYENTILTEEEISIEITGWWFQSVLIDAGANPLFTKLYLSQNTPNFGLQKWRYTIPANANVGEYIEALRNPINERDITLTFLEGWNIFDIDEFLVEKWLINDWDFIVFSESIEKFSELKRDYPFISDAQTLEGFLYPDTYAINPNNFSVKILVDKMLKNFELKVIDSWIINNLWSIEIIDIVNLASIVEKEERNPDEKSTVAGILKKRLEEWWQIWADITVCYPFRLTSEECKLSVTKYLYEKNDYNTRQMVWLPAGPIGNPSAQTIEATIYHKPSEYYYYLHDTQTGKIYYGRTNTEHEENKRLYLR